uniref:Uncharacterized protein n=1 Tax=Caenorhabditis japonica TaxID=281687 RepID=A0A8R1EPT2_CAEJA
MQILLTFICITCQCANYGRRHFPPRPWRSEPVRTKNKKIHVARTYKLHYPGYTIFCRETRSMSGIYGYSADYDAVRRLLGELFGSRTVDIPSNAIAVSIPTKHYRTGKHAHSFVPVRRSLVRRTPKFLHEMWSASVQAVSVFNTDQLVGVCIHLCKENRWDPSCRIDSRLIIGKMRGQVVRYSGEWRPPLVPPLAFYDSRDGGEAYQHRNTISGLMARIQPRRVETIARVLATSPPRRHSSEDVIPPSDSQSCSGCESICTEGPPDYETLIEDETPPPLYWSLIIDGTKYRNM